MTTEDDYREFRNLPLEDQLRFGNMKNWKAGIEDWEIGEDVPEEGEPKCQNKKQENKQEVTLKTVGCRSVCAMRTTLNMADYMKKNKS